MRRALVILLLVLAVPFQGAWSAAARYCVDGDGAAQTHFGHHTHIDIGDDGHGAAKQPVHGDCVACHFVSMHAVFADTAMPMTDMAVAAIRFAPLHDAFESRPAAVPERPKWPRLA
ncbi:heavy metal resistance regulator [Pigmentiphaga soli]